MTANDQLRTLIVNRRQKQHMASNYAQLSLTVAPLIIDGASDGQANSITRTLGSKSRCAKVDTTEVLALRPGESRRPFALLKYPIVGLIFRAAQTIESLAATFTRVSGEVSCHDYE